MKSRFSRIFVYLLIVMSAIVILTWAIRPPEGEVPPLSERTADFVLNPSFVWLGWLSGLWTAAGIIIYVTGYTLSYYQSKRDAEVAFNNVARESLKEMISPDIVPREPLGKQLAKLRALGYTDLGMYEAPFPINQPAPVWVLNSPERDVRAIGVMVNNAIAPSITLNTTFQDLSFVETSFPSFTLALRHPDHMFMIPASIETAIKSHKKRSDKAAAKHGEPVKLNSFAEFSKVVQRGVQQSEASGPRKYKMQLPSLAAGGLIVFALQVGFLVLTPDSVPLICVFGSFVAGVMLIRMGYLLWVGTRQSAK